MKKNSFVEGTIIAYVLILITKVIGAIYVIPFYKIIGESGGVLYGYAYNVYNLFLNISTSGIPTAISIIISEYNALKMFNEREFAYKTSNKVIAIISFISFLIMFIFAKQLALFFIGDLDGTSTINSVTLVIRIISLCLLVVPFLSVTRGYLQGNKYVSVPSISQLIEQVIRILIVLIGSYITINVLHLDIPIGVSVALLGTVIGAVSALLYLKYKIKKNKENFLKDVDKTIKSSVSQKEIIKKIIKLAIPISIIAIIQNLYEITDLKLILIGLYKIGFSAEKCEIIGSIVVTWAPKICMVINALALGLCASVIPYIVEGHVNKNNKLMNDKFNQSINTIIFVSIPIALFIIAFKDPIYYIFYSKSQYGGIILAMMSIVSIFFSISLVINMVLQGMKKYKLVYISTILGLGINALLDIPMILLLNKINFYPYLGTLVSTIIGQLVSISIVFVVLKKEYNFKYKEISSIFIKMVFPLICMYLIIYIFKLTFDMNVSYLLTIIKLGIVGTLSVLVYLIIAYKNKLLEKALGTEIINKFLKKINIKKNRSK